jgi:hypothetical protein
MRSRTGLGAAGIAGMARALRDGCVKLPARWAKTLGFPLVLRGIGGY